MVKKDYGALSAGKLLGTYHYRRQPHNSDHQIATPRPLTAQHSSDSLGLERMKVVDSSCHKCAEQWPLSTVHSIRGSVLRHSSVQTNVRLFSLQTGTHAQLYQQTNKDTIVKSPVSIHYVRHCPLSKADTMDNAHDMQCTVLYVHSNLQAPLYNRRSSGKAKIVTYCVCVCACVCVCVCVCV